MTHRMHSIPKLSRYQEISMERLAEVGDLKRSQVARPGDHICLPFQCPNCQSQNIRGMDLEKEIIEEAAFECMVNRAYLDAFWSGTSTTVQRHLPEVRYMIRYGKSFRFDPLLPLGPFLLGQHLGMMQAVLVEMLSMEKGQKEVRNVD